VLSRGRNSQLSRRVGVPTWLHPVTAMPPLTFRGKRATRDNIMPRSASDFLDDGHIVLRCGAGRSIRRSSVEPGTQELIEQALPDPEITADVLCWPTGRTGEPGIAHLGLSVAGGQEPPAPPACDAARLCPALEEASA